MARFRPFSEGLRSGDRVLTAFGPGVVVVDPEGAVTILLDEADPNPLPQGGAVEQR